MLAIDERLAPAFLQLTYPAMRPALLCAGRDPSILAFGAQDDGLPVALALGYVQDGAVQVLSLFTAEEYRNRGVASGLLASLELTALGAGAGRLELTYMTGRASEPALTRVLDKQHWSAPEKRMQFLKAHTRPLDQAPRWIRVATAPVGACAFPWHELDAKAGQRLRDSQARNPWVPREVDPFVILPSEPPFDRDTSIGLLYRGELAGWLITHRIAPDTIRYSRWCVHPDLRRGAAGPFLLAEAIRRQITRTDATGLQLGVKADNRVMFRFLERHLAGCFFDSWCSMGRSKQLQ